MQNENDPNSCVICFPSLSSFMASNLAKRILVQRLIISLLIALLRLYTIYFRYARLCSSISPTKHSMLTVRRLFLKDHELPSVYRVRLKSSPPTLSGKWPGVTVPFCSTLYVSCVDVKESLPAALMPPTVCLVIRARMSESI